MGVNWEDGVNPHAAILCALSLYGNVLQLMDYQTMTGKLHKMMNLQCALGAQRKEQL